MAPTAPVSPEAIDIAIQYTSTASTPPTADGSNTNPKMNQAHDAIPTAPASRAVQSQIGVTRRATPV
jgi:hypothetical protein